MNVLLHDMKHCTQLKTIQLESKLRLKKTKVMKNQGHISANCTSGQGLLELIRLFFQINSHFYYCYFPNYPLTKNKYALILPTHIKLLFKS